MRCFEDKKKSKMYCENWKNKEYGSLRIFILITRCNNILDILGKAK